MSYKPGDAYYGEFCTSNPTTFAPQNADSIPVAVATHNGVDDPSFVLTVALLATGRYKVTGTIPSGYGTGDNVAVSVTATVLGAAGQDVIDVFQMAGSPAPVGATIITDLAGGSSRSPSNMTVLNGSGQPVPGATVQIYSTAAWTANPATAQVIGIALTDNQGHWTTPVATGSGPCTVVAYYPGVQSAMGSVTV